MSKPSFPFVLIFHILICIQLICGSSAAKSTPTVIKQSNADLLFTPGEGGFVSTWLKIGPFSPPKYIAKKENSVASWNPIPTLSMKHVHHKSRLAAKQFEVITTGSARIGLKPKTPSVLYLAAIVESPIRQSGYLSTSSTAGIEVFVNGVKLHSAAVHRNWVRKDVNLVPIEFSQGKNLVVIRLWKVKPGRWSTYLRFMDKEFRRASNLLFRLPKAQSEATRVFKESGHIALKRDLNLTKQRITVDAWLRFLGAKPIVKFTSSLFKVDAGDSVEVSTQIQLDHPHKTQFLLRRFSNSTQIPKRLTLKFDNATTFTANIGIAPKHLTKLFSCQKRFEQIDTKIFPKSTTQSIEWRIAHLSTLLKNGDMGYEYISRELDYTDKMIARLVQGEDPYANQGNQLQRRGYRSSIDGELHHYALYVPPGWKENSERTYPLIVALHGLNGHPVKTISTLFGNPMLEDDTREKRIRFPGTIGRAPMFVVAPTAFGSSGYYTLGEQDVLDVISEVQKRYRIDETRIYITGASMGGTGAAKIPLHFPDRFAAAVPLCGYHNLHYNSQVRNQPLRPLERYLLEVNSNIHWVNNGSHLPLHLVHGTKDYPRQSKDLQEYYQLAGLTSELTLLDAGHNIWDETYKDGWIFTHFSKYRQNLHPKKIRFRTANLRYNKNHWIQIDGMRDYRNWASVEASVGANQDVTITTDNINILTIQKDAQLFTLSSIATTIDKQLIENLHFKNDRLTLYRVNKKWTPTAPAASFALQKKPALAGPLDDAQNEPLLFVYGTVTPYEGILARRIIGHLKTPRYGVTVNWKVKADVEVTDEDIKNFSLVIVGTPNGNELLQRIENKLPIRSKENAIYVGNKKFEGNRVAASFIYPNPLNPNRYVIVHMGQSAEALFFAAHPPHLLPDYVVYDASNWGETNGTVLGKNRSVLAEGFFDNHWELSD